MMLTLSVVVMPSTAPASAATAPAVACQVGPPSAEHESLVSTSASYAAIWRLYQAYFLRQPDGPGMDYWMSQYQSGLGLGAISLYFSQSDEFRLRYGNLADSEFMDLIYQNVMCRPRDEAGFNYWVNLLAAEPGFDRGDLMVQFSESVEYRNKTNTQPPSLTPLDSATWANDGYHQRSITGGYAVELDYDRVDFGAGTSRCSVASINGNWFSPPEATNPQPTGFAVVDGRTIDNGVDRSDRGIFGERWSTTSENYTLVESWKPQPHPTFNLSSTLATKGDRVLESYGGYRPQENFLTIPKIDIPSEWRWAAAGIPMIINGQRKRDVFDPAVRDYAWRYTYLTTRHSFVAFDKDVGKLMFGSTTGLTAFQIADLVEAEGYDDFIKFDGGGSVEFNVAGVVRVAGTPRDVPLWLGIGC